MGRFGVSWTDSGYRGQNSGYRGQNGLYIRGIVDKHFYKIRVICSIDNYTFQNTSLRVNV